MQTHETTCFSPQALRRIILDESKRAGVGHIGSSLSIVDIIYVLYSGILRLKSNGYSQDDCFILSKGHAALALYGALFLTGTIAKQDLQTYCSDGTNCGVHPEHRLNGVSFSTGSLGHGLAYGAGVALAAKMQNLDTHVYTLISDAECNEGSTWETVMFAAHHKLSNLTVIVDLNGCQALGKTKDVLNLSPFVDKWLAFGWETIETDGHNVEALKKSLKNIDTTTGRPHVLIAKTVNGKGVSFMEDKIEWHYLPLSDEQYQTAMDEINKSGLSK